jgi:hypothetical protein
MSQSFLKKRRDFVWIARIARIGGLDSQDRSLERRLRRKKSQQSCLYICHVWIPWIARLDDESVRFLLFSPVVGCWLRCSRRSWTKRNVWRGKQKNNTRDSNVVPHRSTNRARRCLTSLSRREAVLSSWYGRSYLMYSCVTIYTLS